MYALCRNHHESRIASVYKQQQKTGILTKCFALEEVLTDWQMIQQFPAEENIER